MADERSDDDVVPDEPAGPCRSCGTPTSSSQRYCLSCGELVGQRRLEPLEILRARAGEPAAPAPAPHGRAVPFAAAAAAILVAGFAGSLVPGAGSGARAAVITQPAVAAVPAPPAATTAAAPPTTTQDDAATTDEAPATDDAAATTDDATADAAATTDTADSGDSGDTGTDTTDDSTTPDDPTIPPHVWLLALDGPAAKEAVDRIADQGVRLTGVRPVAADTIANASTLLTGTLPLAAGSPAPDPAAAVPPSLPEELTTAGQTWRTYVDAQPGTGDPLPGACTDPAPGDAGAALTATRTPFGRIAALRTDDACAKGTSSLETLGNDVSSGDTLPSFSYATLGGCAPPDRTAVALPDQVADTLTAITESTEFQDSGLIVVTAVGSADPCPAAAVPGTSTPAPATTPAAPTDPATPTPTVVLRADAKPGSTLDVAADLRALARLTAKTLGVDPPGTSGADDVPALEIPPAAGR
ncbi:hypothetical protein AB0L40_00140 [Patulibacter sp. NPDC049589]|uniref:hypothetical protein n=1 Tax=Patulibacter sp. NPDC049589 TaxID=3154731 RepID=UPI0034346FCF